MVLDPKWLDALKLPLRLTFAVALAASFLFGLEVQGVLDLGPLSLYTRPVLLIIAVVFWTVTIVGALQFLFAPLWERRRQEILSTRRAVRQKEHEEQRDANRTAVLARLDHLSDKEIRYVAECLRAGTPTFYTYVHSSPVRIMIGKGLVWSPGSQHHQDRYPFSFHDFVWEALLARKDEFIAKDEDRIRAETARL
ncbi:MAG: hypothetical protein EA385_14180 [Salinarimonadaceae bacterium]|nr:MAG: hypothetical protein EA385_14180 [Salinarimonadaceae bacterium]